MGCSIKIYSRITQLLTCHYDITLLLAMLDFCLSISEQRPHLLVKDSNKILIKILLILLNCEASQHFTACSLKKIKLIDERPQVRAQVNSAADSNSSQITSHSATQPISQLNNSQSIIVDNETFALNWLRNTYEPITTNCIQSQSLKVSELYADYVKYCCRSSRRNVIAAQSFSQLIKRCFPSCSITNNSTLIEGIIVKSISNDTIQTKSNQTPISQLASPILKAHLSAPPKNSNNSSTSNNNNVNNNNSNNNKISNNNDLTNCNTISLTPTTNTSTLIKSLLANKLRSNATVSTTTVTPTKTLYNDTATLIVGTKESANSCKSESLSVVVSQQQQLPPQSQPSQQPQPQPQQTSITFTPFTPSITFTTSNTVINASNATISTQALQQPAQQFLLVRTIITPTGQQQSGCSGLTTTGTPVRLILPASMLTQQRLNNPTVNGITSTSASINNATISTTNSINNNTVTNISANTSSSDLFLKTVLSGNNASNSLSVSPIRSNVKSSPLLNVLLDKGKLPDFASSQSIINNQVNANAFGSLTNTANVNVLQQQAPKMYIITTKSPLAIKSLPNLQTQTVTQSAQQATQTISQQITSNSSVVQSQNTLQSLQTSNFLSNATLSNVQSFSLTTNLNHQNKTLNSSKICIPSQINGELGPTITAVPSIKANILNTSDLSSIKDIKKTVDDATKLIAKRQTEEESINANKKVKLNSVLVNPITQCVTSSQIIVNHDSNTQVLSKACSTAATTTTVTTATTTSSNLVNSVSNNSTCSEYECQWHECKKSFSRAAEVFLHVHNHHVMPSTFPDSMTCLWGGTEGTGPGCLSKRPKLSLLTHLLDFHCNQNILHQEVARKKQIASKGSTSIVLQQPPAHPGYAHNAALLAIRRHATNYVEMPTVPPVTQLTPLTVSIRLTAALILRNLAQHSSFVKRSLEFYEPYLCELSMADGRDESRTIAQCLAVINERNMLND